ncbi:MAG: methylmalonyl-CoA epimerase [Candidatus Nephthysia bennettiae]|uniref:Methylmalonyl-CoA epimerase n=1 Tax=Candidatus Nephthysia bennettiae TaxID=3127016 RepID=A0A934K592_9BACT|nr:methylmalonyl-CoA epimerase [Candidatus Dormibacteraeota bacterium]MBJ7612252.1 methylmalonyl-CoA epimerase [Candidatus Dormibacteraeota bacterium]PZR88005.1 MAG: methylmalonyl-CoA epimerase [Candidatus Dormibacteraeota bacterium]
MLRRISHLGLAVKDLDAAVRLYEGVFGLEAERRWVAEADQMRAASFRVGEVEIELMEPLAPDSPVGRFIARRGEGIHHVAYRVDDVAEALDSARSAGMDTIDERPRVGGGGSTRIGFLHPRSTFGVLTELEEDVREG